MATYQSIYELESVIAGAWKTLLASELGAAVQLRVPMVDDPAQPADVKVPSVFIRANNSGQSNHLVTQPAQLVGSLRVHGQWDFDIGLRITTDRVQANGPAHKTIRALCRKVAGTTAQASWNAAFINTAYEVLIITERASSYAVNEEDHLDITELNFDMKLRVLTGAWPT